MPLQIQNGAFSFLAEYNFFFNRGFSIKITWRMEMKELDTQVKIQRIPM